jgi:hypothetical protein
MIRKKIYWVLFVLSFSTFVYSQNTIPSNAYLQACYNSHECYSINNSAFIYLDPDNKAFMVEIHFSGFKMGNDSLDEWLNYLPDSHLVFKGYIKHEDELGGKHPVLKPIVIMGNIQLNGISKPYHLQIMLTGNPVDGSQFVSNTKGHFDMGYASMQLSFNPHDFKMDSKNHHYKKTIKIAISKGYINYFTPEMKLAQENNSF